MKRSADSAFVVEHLPATPESAYSPAPSPAESSVDCPPRKRSRSDITPEERKEARAHRNRIAAQNSRDRRKAQFSVLERRVSELEEENRQLRAGMGISVVPSPHDNDAEQRARELAREKENQELRERIKTLENGWDAVIKALAASGLPLAVPPPPSVTAPSCSATPFSASPAPILPPSPAPSSVSSHGFEFDEFDSTRHLARVATADAPLLSSVSLQRLGLELNNLPSAPTFTDASTTSPIDETAMENLLREILAPSPLLSSAPLPLGPTDEESSQSPAASTDAQGLTSLQETTLDWEGEVEMQRLLDLLPDTKTMDVNLDSVDFASTLDLWDMAAVIHPPPPSVGVF